MGFIRTYFSELGKRDLEGGCGVLAGGRRDRPPHSRYDESMMPMATEDKDLMSRAHRAENLFNWFNSSFQGWVSKGIGMFKQP